MRTLHIEMGRNRLGGTMQTFYLARGLVEKGVDVKIVCPSGSPLHKLSVENNIGVLPVKYLGDLDLTFIFKVYYFSIIYKPDIIHIHSRRGADTLGLIGAWLFSKSKIIVSRRVDDPLPKNFFTKLRYQKIPDCVIAVSKGIKNVLIESGIDEKKIKQIYSSIEIKKYQSDKSKDFCRNILNIDNDCNVIVVIAQLIKRKGHNFLLDAIPTIINSNKNTKFLFVGEGKERESIQGRIKELNLQDHVFLLGYKDNIADILKASDILVHPATMEGFANVALQAMASELPVVSSAVGGMPESVRNQVNGLTIPPANPGRLAEAILFLLANPQVRAEMGRRGREIVEQEFTVDIMVEKIREVYVELLSEK